VRGRGRELSEKPYVPEYIVSDAYWAGMGFWAGCLGLINRGGFFIKNATVNPFTMPIIITAMVN